MKSSDQHTLRQLMAEASALPPDEPQRQELERRIGNEGAWAQQEWSLLLRENACLRTALQEVDVPQDLERRLLAVRETAVRRRTFVGRWRWPIATVAAALFMIGVVELMQSRTDSSRLQTVVLLAIDNHLNDQHVSVQTADPRQLEQALEGQVPFDVLIPDLGSDLQLVGGRKCKLGTHPVAYSQWNGPDGDYSLFQFRPDDFGVSERISQTLVRSQEPAGAQHPGGAWIWTEGPHGYVLTGDPENDLRRISPGSKSAK